MHYNLDLTWVWLNIQIVYINWCFLKTTGHNSFCHPVNKIISNSKMGKATPSSLKLFSWDFAWRSDSWLTLGIHFKNVKIKFTTTFFPHFSRFFEKINKTFAHWKSIKQDKICFAVKISQNEKISRHKKGGKIFVFQDNLFRLCRETVYLYYMWSV